MLGYLDPVLFPDEILVIELTKDRYVYPIYKNASSSLFETAQDTLNTDKIKQIEHIEVFVREPFERYVSGVQTYLRLNPHLDRATVLSMIDEYLFLNRHFTLQFHWIVNLIRFNPDVQITFRTMQELDTATHLTWNALTRDQTLIDYFKENKKLWFYLQLDKILTEDFIGQTVKFKTILAHIKDKYPVIYKETIERSKEICAVLD
jgi:hypothetical protein